MALLAAACLISPNSHAAGKCQIAKIGELPITMNSLRPVVPAKINGRDAKFVLDSGAFYSMITRATADEYQLKRSPGPWGMVVTGVGGTADVDTTTVKEFSIIGVTIKNVEFLVGGSEVGSEGLLGQNFLERFDVEYDLANGAIRLFRTEDCEHARLAYWLQPDQSFSYMHIDRIDPLHPHTVGEAYVNGERIRVAFDTGAFTSLLSFKAAARAGIKADSPGVVDAGTAGGIGRGRARSYIGTFASFKIGDGEEIKNAKLRFADMDLEMADMLLGADFFVSHRIFVANKEHRLFLSYNGGAVFNLSKGANSAASAEPRGNDQARAAEQPSSAAPTSTAAASADAAEIARHGSALAARRDFVPALAELSKAIELSPNDPEFYYQRADAYWANNQADLALADFDHVIALKQDFLPAYLPRAEIKLLKHDEQGALADLESVDTLSPKQADLRLTLAQIYARTERLPAATEQFGLWMQNHPDDSRMGQALGDRCYYNALQGRDLSSALSDCNSALRRTDKTDESYPYLLADRAMVRLRQGEIAKAVSDCNDALKISPKNARALYVRAVAESRQNKKNESAADLESAEVIAPKIAVRFERYGIVP
jgi:predicted aspartyl protease/tetratricopeptide (TPR) repeat protein